MAILHDILTQAIAEQRDGRESLQINRELIFGIFIWMEMRRW